jgi:protein-S-isoprenylcysteine O-methyltransferase Ste14
MRTLELKIPPVVVGLVLGTAMYAAARLAPAFGFVLPANRIIAAGLAALGAFIAILGVISFRRAGTTVNPLQPEAASQLVISGVYRWTRNPMYLGMLLVLLGWGVFLAHTLAFISAAAFIPLMNRLQIGPEEKILTATFGPAFTAYQSVVRRWL